MKYLVIGGQGFVGRAVCAELESRGAVTILEQPQASGCGANILKADITDLTSLKETLAGFDTVVHLAGIFSKKGVNPSPADLFEVNVKGTFNVLEACAVNGVKKVVFASSICAFGTAPDTLPVKEEDSPKPGGLGSATYGMTKFLGEGLCRSYTHAHGMTTLCLRLAVVKDLRAGTGLPGSVGTLWSYVDVRDVAQAFRLACERKGLSHEVFFIAAADTLSSVPNRELIQKDMPWMAEAAVAADFLKRDFASFYSIEKAKIILGYTPSYSWRGRYGRQGSAIA